MNLITVHYDNITNIISKSEWKLLWNGYSDIVNGQLESLPGQVLLQAGETVTSHTVAPEHIPVSMIPQVQEELRCLKQLDNHRYQKVWWHPHLHRSKTLEQRADLVVFYGVSTLERYLIPNRAYIYIYIYNDL